MFLFQIFFFRFKAIFQKIEYPRDLSDFELCSTFKSKINNIHLGIHEYIPIIFDDEYFSLVNITLHTFVFGFS